jgi:hypothetical protein
VALPTTADGVAARMREIDAELDPDDGVAVFNRVYLTVAERIAALLAAPGADPPFRDAETMAELDVRFANLWFTAYDAAAAGRRPPAAWRPVFEARAGRGRVPVQFAIAGMNSHIEHDLPIAVVDTCRARDLEPDDVHQDYEAVNDVLAQVEAEIRRSFLDEVGRAADDHLGPVAHLISAWSIDKARDLSWVTVETLWALRRTSFLQGRFLDGLAHTVGMTSRTLLTPLV